MRNDSAYVHGYSEREAERLYDQASSVKNLIHADIAYPPGSVVLEAGCGVGAQTLTLALNSPEANFLSVDHSKESLLLAREAIKRHKIDNVEFFESDVFTSPIQEESVDHVFVCHLLEHLPDPINGLLALRKYMKPKGSITVFEGDHGSCYFHPETKESVKVWRCLIEVQRRLGTSSLVGRELFPMLEDSGFRNIRVMPKMVYIDKAAPELQESFVSKTIIPMVEGVKIHSLDLGLIDKNMWRQGMEDLSRTWLNNNGVFCYTFFKGTAFR